MKLYRAMVTKGKKGTIRLGKGFPVKLRSSLRETASKDTGLSFDSDLIRFGSIDSKLTKILIDNGFVFAAYAAHTECRLRDVVYYFSNKGA